MRAVLWADVPAGNQIAYANPLATSSYENITPTELQALRDGTVSEKTVTFAQTSGALSLSTAQAAFQTMQADFQAEVTAYAAWQDYGRFWDGTAWQSPTGVPMFAATDKVEGLPAFIALTPVSAFAVSKFQFVLYNGAPVATSQTLLVKVRLLVFVPGSTVVTGVLAGFWSVNRREGLTTAPSGAGGITVTPMDSAHVLSSLITAFNAPGTSPAGGTAKPVAVFLPQSDEIKLNTLDLPGMASLGNFGGQVIYNDDLLKSCRPLTIRAGQTLEVQQGVTGGTGNGQILCVFTVG